MDKHIEDFKKIKEMVGEFAHKITEEDKYVNVSNISAVKDLASAWLKLCEICEDDDSGEYGARRRDSRGRYMDGGSRPMGGGYNTGYGWMPGPYYAGGNYSGGYGMDKTALADELEGMASSGMGDPEMVKSLREAARHLRKG